MWLDEAGAAYLEDYWSQVWVAMADPEESEKRNRSQGFLIISSYLMSVPARDERPRKQRQQLDLFVVFSLFIYYFLCIILLFEECDYVWYCDLVELLSLCFPALQL